MEYVLLSDLHSNYPALQEAINREGTDATYIILGDIIGLNGFPKETINAVRKVGDYILAGNHDYAVFHMEEGHTNSNALSDYEYNHTVDALPQEDIEWAKDLPYLNVIEKRGRRICLTHAQPWPEDAIGYAMGNAGVPEGNVPHFASIVSDDYEYVFHGHTHEQYSLDCEQFGHDVQFVNPGSLGYNGTYSVIDTETGEVDEKTVKYDEHRVKSQISAKLPSDAPSVSEWL